MDFELIQNELVKTFKVSANDINYFGHNSHSELLEYSIKLEAFTPEINSSWSKNFPAGSYFSISKESNSSKLTLIVTISDNDYSEYFQLKHPEIKLNKMGIVEAIKN